MTPLLTVEDLEIGFGRDQSVVSNVSFEVPPGETLALVGESGSGKTITCRSVLRILPRTAQVRSGRIVFNGREGSVELSSMTERQMRHVRGNAISMIFQEPMRSLSPLHKIGNQVSEVLWIHRGMSEAEAKRDVLQEFEHVGFPDPEQTYNSYPFEMSGGMRQRAMIAMAMVAKPELLIADEPTTALDVTTQAQVLGLINDLQKETGMSVILVTHDLGVVANMAEHVVVMHRGRIMEQGAAHPILSDPAHAYTKQLFAAAPEIPTVTEPAPAVERVDPILEMTGVNKTFKLRASVAWKPDILARAVRGVDLSLERGKTLAIVGESGSGKTTCAKIALGAETPDPGGQVLFRAKAGDDPVVVNEMSREERVAFQRNAQMVFQDPYSSLSPRMRIQDALTEPLEIHGIGNATERRDRAEALIEQVGLKADMLQRYPHAFSGGQRQRLSIARALMLDPVLLVCDEPTSALDVSVQEQILSLLEEIRDMHNLSYLFISHDLAVVARIADEVAVMRAGIIVEKKTANTLFYDPVHPYTKALIAAQPEPDVNRPIDLATVAQGAGSPQSWPDAFRFGEEDIPALTLMSPGHKVRCHV